MSEITYSIIDPSKSEEVAELLLRSFFIEEPLGLALGLTTDQVTRWLSAHTLSAVEHGVSYMATVEEDGGTRIVGVSINVIKTPDFDPPGIMDYVDKETEPNMWQVSRFLTLLNEDLDISTLVLGGAVPERTMLCLFLNVDKDYAGRGIGKSLVIKSEELAIMKDVCLLQVDTTSEFSYKVFSKLGFSTIRSIPFDQFTDENGIKLIDEEIIGVHQYGRVLIKILQPTQSPAILLED